MINPRYYARPHTIEEAVRYLENAEAFPLRGGALALGKLRLPYEVVVDLQDVTDLTHVHALENGVSMGSAATLQDIVEAPDVPMVFKRAITRTLPVNIRNNASLLETLLVERPPCELVTAFAAHDVTINMTNHEHEQVQFSITETKLVAGEAGHSLRDGLVMSVYAPYMSPGEAIGTAFIARTPADDPILNAAAIVKLAPAEQTVQGAFVALCGASEWHAVDLLSLSDLTGQPLTAANIQAQAAQVAHVVHPPSNYLGSADYRRAMSAVVVRRALEDAAAQLNANAD